MAFMGYVEGSLPKMLSDAGAARLLADHGLDWVDLQESADAGNTLAASVLSQRGQGIALTFLAPWLGY